MQACTLQQDVGVGLVLVQVVGVELSLMLLHFRHGMQRGQRRGQHVAVLQVKQIVLAREL